MAELPASQQVPAASTSGFAWGMVLFVVYRAEMISAFC